MEYRRTFASRLFRFFVLVFLVGIFLELGFFVSMFLEAENPTGNVAIVKIEGPIEDSQAIVEELQKYEENEKIKAIVFRVNSPGGTVGASQEIHDQVLATGKKKIVVGSMGDVAASGGYYVIAPAKRIVANPGTITGSIGVIAHYFVVEDLLKSFHLRWEVVQAGKMKDMGSPLRKLLPEERKILQNMTEDMHAQFIEAVSKGRKMDIQKVSVLADGRVFSGRQAKQEGLVDELGSLEKAIEVAARLAKIVDKPKVIYPKEKSFSWLRQLAEGKIRVPQLLQIGYRLFP